MNPFTKFTMAAVLLTALSGCEVDQTQEGEMPEVDVKGGQAPRYDVEGPDVDVGTKKKEVTVPTVDVDAPEDN